MGRFCSYELWALEYGAFGTIIKRWSSCPSATAYEETSKTTVNDDSTSVTYGCNAIYQTGISAGDIVNFGDRVRVQSY